MSGASITRNENDQKVTFSTNYAYDYNGNRVWSRLSKNNTEVERYYLLDNGLANYVHVFEEMNENGGTPICTNTLGYGVISQTQNDEINYLLYDGIGSTRMIANSSGSIVETYDYDAFGQILHTSPGVTSKDALTNILFVGEQFDPELQMIYLRARYYDSSIGRFNRLDPIIGDLDDPLSINNYTYAHSDPVNNVDPSGEFVGVFLSLAVASFNILTAQYILDHFLRSVSNFNVANQLVDYDNATIMIHGVYPRPYTSAYPFFEALRERGADRQDYYEYLWSGFAFPAIVIPGIGHFVAVEGFRRAVCRLHEKGYERVNIIAHSWGTYISEAVLNGPAGSGPINTWITMGSPLSNHAVYPPQVQEWVNIWAPNDPICEVGWMWNSFSQALSYPLYYRQDITQIQTGNVGHTGYWEDNYTLEVISQYLAQ